MQKVLLMVLFAVVALGRPDERLELISFPSAVCGHQETVVSLKITIERKKESRVALMRKKIAFPKVFHDFPELLKAYVKKWDFKPVKVGNSFVSVDRQVLPSCH